MFYNAKPSLFEKAKKLRKNMTHSEEKLWDVLKRKQIQSLCFRAQHPVDIFIADFYCHELKLVIEIDGEYHMQHDQKEYDIGRENELESFGIKVIRFTNDQLEKNISEVLNKIEQVCNTRKSELQSPL